METYIIVGIVWMNFTYSKSKEIFSKIVKIHKTRISNVTKSTLRPGQVVEVTEKSLIVQCGKGSLDLLDVQPESRAKMPIAEYLRGYPALPGDLFGPTA